VEVIIYAVPSHEMSPKDVYSFVIAGIEVETMIWSKLARNTQSERLMKGKCYSQHVCEGRHFVYQGRVPVR